MSAISLVESAPIEARIDGLTETVRRLADALEKSASGTEAIWLPRRHLAARFGLTSRNAGLYIAGAVSAGMLEHFRPAGPDGSPGQTLYKVTDFEKYLRRLEPQTA